MKIVAYTLAASLAAGAAYAAGPTTVVSEPQVYAPVAAAPVGVDWSGFYAGLQFGTGDASVAGVDEDFDALGAHVGYNWDLGSYVLGVELDYNDLDVDSGGSGDMTRLRGRVGADLGRFLPYLTLGWADASAVGYSDNGMTYGVGAEYMVTDRFSLGLEYSRQDFSDAVAPGVDLDADLFQLRASFHF